MIRKEIEEASRKKARQRLRAHILELVAGAAILGAVVGYAVS